MSQTLYFGGPIVTMERELYVQALLTEGERILYAGSLHGAEERAEGTVRRVDLKGRALLPAFVDAHSHLTAYANTFLQAGLEECASWEELGRRLSAFAAREGLAPGEWVRGEGYDHYEPEDLLAAYDKAQRSYASYGVATVQEGMMPDQLIPLYRQLLERDLLWLDVVGYADADGQAAEAFSGHIRAYSGHFKLGGYKIFLDGSPQGRTAWMRTPYLGGGPQDRGYPVLTDRQVYDRMALALDQGMQLLAHCNGDAAAGQYLSVLEQLEREREAHLERPVMIHAQLLDLDQLDKVKELGVVPSFFAAHVYHWGDVHVKNFGAERAARISPAGAALERDIPFTFHQDTPVLPPDMLETVWCGVNRLTRSGAVLGPEQKIPVVEALAAVTIRAAWQYFEEGEKGSLREGKRADLVLLERDPLTADPMSLRDIPVLATWKDGRLIYRREG